MKQTVGNTSRIVLAVLAFMILRPCCADEKSSPIADVRFDAPYQQIAASSGDEWAPTWGRDDILYTGNDDGASFGGISDSTIAFGELKGNDPDKLKGATLNGMKDYREAQLLGPEGAMWRALDTYAIEGILYRFVSCAESRSAEGSCIAASMDAGKTWRVIGGGHSPLFPKSKFGAVSFIVYRKEIESLLGGAGQYIYAASYAGVVNGDDNYIVGRVPRTKFGEENPGDWSFEQADQSWKSSVQTASAQPNSADVGPDGANWKVMNAYSVNGVLYAFVTRCFYPWMSGDPKRRHVFRDSSIIMSADEGRTWGRSAQENYHTPMFPGMRFGAPYFVWYGKDGEADVDNADRYVYAVSNNGHFEGGDDYVLGRVLKTKLPKLSAADWSFYKAGDGMREGNWTPSLDNASPILVNPGRSSMTGMTYIAGLHRYAMVVWHYNQVSFETAILKKDLSTVLEFFEAPKPWGPWTRTKSFETGLLGWYAPVIGQRFQTMADHSTVRAFLYTTGFRSKPEGGLDFSLFKLNYLPITLSTKPLPHADLEFVGGK